MCTIVRDWFEGHTYDYARFADPLALARRKRNLGLSVSVLLPCFRVTDTVETAVREICALNEWAPLLDQIAVISVDTSSEAAACPGVETYSADELMSGYVPINGRGDVMWRALSIAHGDLVLYADVETPGFRPHFVYGILAPILRVPRVKFTKAAYERAGPTWGPAGPGFDGGVTELMVRPLLSLHYPELSGFLRPLAREFAAPSEVFRSIPFSSGEAVELAMVIDLLDDIGLDAMAQVNLGVRREEQCQPPAVDPECTSYAILRAVDLRVCWASKHGRSQTHLRFPDAFSEAASYVSPIHSPEEVQLRKHTAKTGERPPMAQVLQGPDSC